MPDNPPASPSRNMTGKARKTHERLSAGKKEKADEATTEIAPVTSAQVTYGRKPVVLNESGRKLTGPELRRRRKLEKLGSLITAEAMRDAGETVPAKREEQLASDGNGEGAGGASLSKRQRKSAEPTGPPAEPFAANDFQSSHNIVVNSKCSQPYETFDAAKEHLGAELFKALKAQGYLTPMPIQTQAWPVALGGHDLVGVAKTGSGKTCAFLIPALARLQERGTAPVPKQLGEFEFETAKPTVLVVVPTRELAQQIAVEAAKFAPAAKARVVAIFGGVPKGDQVRDLNKGADVLVGTPGRLLDFLAGNAKLNRKPPVALRHVNYLVLDEADKLLDMGFENDISRIVAQCKCRSPRPEHGGGASGPMSGTARQTLFFTATWPVSVQKAAAKFTSPDAVQIRIGQEEGHLTANSSVTQTVEVVQPDGKLARLRQLLKSELGSGETAMVFAATRETCDTLAQKICAVMPGIWCRAMHKAKDQKTRDATLTRFRELCLSSRGERGVLIATNVASRGLDIPGVALVVVYDFSHETTGGKAAVESYVHRIGRTGRAGREGRAFTLITKKDWGTCELTEILARAGQTVSPGLAKLAAVEGQRREEGRGGGGPKTERIFHKKVKFDKRKVRKSKE